MKHTSIVIIATILFLVSCKKDESIVNIDVKGYWSVTDPTYTPNNPTVDLYHLFKGEQAYYRFSFFKTQDFSVLAASPRADSLIAYYQVNGSQLMLPSPSPSTTTIFPGNDLLSKTDNEMVFIRNVITKRNVATGVPEQTRMDTIKYVRVTDAVKVAYFNNYLKKWHP